MFFMSWFWGIVCGVVSVRLCCFRVLSVVFLYLPRIMIGCFYVFHVFGRCLFSLFSDPTHTSLIRWKHNMGFSSQVLRDVRDLFACTVFFV